MEIETEPELNRLEFAKARKDMALGRLDVETWEKAAGWQRAHLHQIELTIKSLTIDDLTELEE